MFENIWVSTDSDVIEMEALKHGALVYRRLHVFAQDHSSSLEAIKEFLNKHNFVKKFALFQCTSVFLKEKYIIEAVHKFNFHPCVFAAKSDILFQFLLRKVIYFIFAKKVNFLREQKNEITVNL
ncbi:N-acylneuraminate cytidylyltransferase [Lucilia cuprina]|nr:N-acylneuraminate cytidylyltransferase [Lucilia cuprina]KAI8114716.1 N-acylneuraminate cytidylyltransferase [Lucilia cuprina]KAI8114717.1 N-acylneuraminate cytidylyltransferase [Lucilia cuprina]